MNEALVQWTLLKNTEHLSRYLEFPVTAKRGQEISTEWGRIDFVLEGPKRNQLIVELETVLDSRAKLDDCFRQVLNYRNVRFVDQTDYCILFAAETRNSSQLRINDFGRENSVLIRSYPLTEVRELYGRTVERLSESFGMALPKPKNYTICYLRWLNKILKPFRDSGRPILDLADVARYFSGPRTTNFRCYLRLALDFEMVSVDGDTCRLTANGKEYAENCDINIDRNRNPSSVDLTNEQRRVLLRVLTNGNWTPHKVNIYWFLRFVEVTSGDWLPTTKTFESARLELANGLFGVSYLSRTMYEFLNFACNWCEELGMVERVRLHSNYDRLVLTPLGVEIGNILALDLQVKRSRLNLSFKYL